MRELRLRVFQGGVCLGGPRRAGPGRAMDAALDRRRGAPARVNKLNESRTRVYRVCAIHVCAPLRHNNSSARMFDTTHARLAPRARIK